MLGHVQRGGSPSAFDRVLVIITIVPIDDYGDVLSM